MNPVHVPLSDPRFLPEQGLHLDLQLPGNLRTISSRALSDQALLVPPCHPCSPSPSREHSVAREPKVRGRGARFPSRNRRPVTLT
ncbi:hypothetical protein I79_001370 [Cricetulus griseus]|uniref:Uncharacterized protein n=1 Tax=Cricetulus griseus TaxID=10029 RepID=G3GUK7_CRIGR|nr:hypothetical protein I79_001370 [Cricetulus griseus]